MDPLSVSVSILTMLGTGASLGKAVRKIAGLRGTPDAFLALNNEISDFHLVVSNTDYLIRRYQSTRNVTTRHTDFAVTFGPLLERGKEKLLELECLIEYTLTTRGSNGEVFLNKVTWLRKADQVSRIREDLRSIRASLTMHLGLLASSTALTTEIQVSEPRIVGGEILEQQRQTQGLAD